MTLLQLVHIMNLLSITIADILQLRKMISTTLKWSISSKFVDVRGGVHEKVCACMRNFESVCECMYVCECLCACTFGCVCVRARTRYECNFNNII